MNRETQEDFNSFFEKEAMKALRRASEYAFKLARQTKTPFVVYRDGKVVDLNAPQPRKPREARDVKP